jgi:hypothetical protein
VLRDNSDFTDEPPLCVNRLVYTYLSLQHVPYENQQSADFRLINGEAMYTVNIGNFKFVALLDT